MRRIYLRRKTRKILGIISIFIGIVIIMRVVPLNFIFFLFGILLVLAGLYMIQWLRK